MFRMMIDLSQAERMTLLRAIDLKIDLSSLSIDPEAIEGWYASIIHSSIDIRHSSGGKYETQ